MKAQTKALAACTCPHVGRRQMAEVSKPKNETSSRKCTLVIGSSIICDRAFATAKNIKPAADFESIGFGVFPILLRIERLATI